MSSPLLDSRSKASEKCSVIKNVVDAVVARLTPRFASPHAARDGEHLLGEQP
jgi:hypothetical protein